MKKFLYAAVMALTVAFMASCGGTPTSYKYADGENPTIDVMKGTVNGTSYDNETQKCWKVTYKSTSTTFDEYEFTTEFLLVAAAETWVAELNHMGMKGGYSYIVVAGKNDYESCENLNEDYD